MNHTVDRAFIDNLKEISRENYSAANRSYKFEENEGCREFRKELLEFREELDFEFVTQELKAFRLLNLHESMTLSNHPNVSILHVLGGWIYTVNDQSVFVPEISQAETIRLIKEAKEKLAKEAWEQVK